jgi:hypothetical protein
MILRYCPECDEEFQPHVERCSDCGGELEDRTEEDLAREREEQSTDAPQIPEDAVVVVRGVDPGTARAIAFDLHGAGIPFWLGGGRRGIEVRVRSEDRQAACVVLERAGVLPAQATSDEVVAASGGPCPACGVHVDAGVSECPTCGLGLADETVVCRGCGEEVVLSAGRCPSCGGSLLYDDRPGGD